MWYKKTTQKQNKQKQTKNLQMQSWNFSDMLKRKYMQAPTHFQWEHNDVILVSGSLRSENPHVATSSIHKQQNSKMELIRNAVYTGPV